MKPEPGRRTLIIACGALALELRHLTDAYELAGVRVECIPASLHNRPAEIPAALRSRIDRARGRYDDILVGYADCGTAGEIDAICREESIERLPGAHCYQFFAGSDRFDAMHEADPTVFYLTDYLVRHFDRLIMGGLGINDHPELLPIYFGNYTTVRYLAQTDNAELDALACQAATTLGLRYDRVPTGYGELGEVVVSFGRRAEMAS